VRLIDEAQLLALIGGQHNDPFAVLGLHAAADGRLWLRALLPGALSVEVLDAGTGAALVALKQGRADGFFEAAIPRRRKPFNYRLRVAWAHGIEQVLADAYSFATHGPGWYSARIRHDNTVSMACASRSGHRMRAAPAWSATSTPGTDAGIQCACATWPASGRSLFRTPPLAIATNSNCLRATAACCH